VDDKGDFLRFYEESEKSPLSLTLFLQEPTIKQQPKRSAI
jgi:hypothetical protein